MSPRHIIISPEGLADLEAIWVHVAATASATIASDFVEKFLDAFEKLAAMPGIGHRRADVQDVCYRFWSVKSYVIAYRADVQTLRIARVVYGHRDFRQIFDR